MSTERRSTPPLQPKGNKLEPLVWGFCFVMLVVFVLANAERGANSPSTRNPGGVERLNPADVFLPNFDIVFWGQVMAVLLSIAMVVGFIWGWRRHPKHPFLLMMLASTSVCWLDPINNWSIHLVYNPRLWHFPQDWPWVGLSPIIEPLMNVAYAPFVMMPYLISISLLKRLQAKATRDAFVWRRPLVALAALTVAATFIWDSAQEIFLVATRFYTYSHIVPFGSIFVGKYYQFPLLMASGLISLLMIPAALLLYRDDSGATQAERIAKRFKLFERRPGTTTFLVMAAALNLSFMTFISIFFVVRLTGAATSVACPWPYPQSVVFDPSGYYEQNGEPGPYWEGRMNNWISGHPDGRPQHANKISDRCSEKTS